MKKLWLALCLTVSAAQVACMEEPGIVVPDELVGTWTTPAPKYSDRGFEIWTDAIVFYTGTAMEDFTVHGIRELIAEPVGDRTEYTIEYRSKEGALATMAFDLDSSDGLLRFKNQQLVEWQRNPETSQIQN